MCILCLAVLSSGATAQTPAASVSGHVTASDGTPIFSAIIHVPEKSYSASTDTSGYYRVDNMAPGQYVLIFTHLNYEADTLSVRVSDGQTLTLDVKLPEKLSALNEVEIIGKTESQELKEKPFQVEVVDVQPLQQRNLDVNKILNQSSGVRVRQNAGLGSSFDLTLNGFKAAQFINGIPIEVYGSAYAFNSIPVNQIQRIEIFKGVVPVYLGGDALGGAVNIVTSNTLKNNLNLSYSIGSFNTHKASVRGVHRDSSGLTVIGSAFINHSDNDYVMRDMEILSGTRTYKRDVKRFHDTFRSYAARGELGYTNKPYADALMIGSGFSKMRKDIQTGSSQYPPIGEATGEESNHQLSLRYSKHSLFNNKVDVDGFILLNNTNTIFVDTASRIYQWDGTILIQRPSTSTIGEFEEKQIYKTQQRDLTHRYNVAYHLSPEQTVTLNMVANVSNWSNTDEGEVEGTSLDDNSSRYSKTIVGLGHDARFLDERIQTTAFVKYYRMNAGIDSASRWRGGYFDLAPLQTTKSFTGGGLGVSYSVSPNLLVKASAEYACRLPTTYELLGDGINTVSNVSLEPELSMNYNAALSSRLIDRSSVMLSVDGGLFYRKAQNFIRATTGVRRSTYINFDAALVRGIESEVRLVLNRRFAFRINGTYQQVLDDNKYVGGTLRNYSYRIQLPNTPSLFGNAEAEYKITRVFHDRLEIVPYYNLLYVKEFYLGYANIARGDLKYTIPMQLVHDIGLTISGASEKYSLALECSNLTNALAFDNFRLQKAGRAFTLKINYNIH